MSKKFTVLLVLGALVIAACGDAAETTTTAGGEACGPEHPALHEQGKLTVATGDVVFPPWMLDDDPAGGEGFENAIVYELAEELGFERDDVVWVRTTFDEALVAGDKPYDFNIQQFSITPEREQTVISLYYQEQLTMKEVGGVLGLTESRVSQLHSQAMVRLRLHLRERLVPGEVDGAVG